MYAPYKYMHLTGIHTDICTHLSYYIMFYHSLGCMFKEQILILISASSFILRYANDVPPFPSIYKGTTITFLFHSRNKFSHINSQ